MTNLQRLKLQNVMLADKGTEHIVTMTNLWTLYLDLTQITEDGLANRKGLTKLERLTILQHEKITGSSLVCLEGLTNLKDLLLSETNISDRGLVHLEGLANLKQLALSRHKNVTDKGLVHLQGLTKLKELTLMQTQVSDEG